MEGSLRRRKKTGKLFNIIFKSNISKFYFCVCYLRMQMQTLCRAVEILITTSCSTSVKIFYSSLTAVFIASPFCDQGHEGQVKRNHVVNHDECRH